MKYNVGDRVRIKSINWYNKNKDTGGNVPCGEYDFVSNMSVFCGKILTIDVDFGDETYLMKEDNDGFVFTNEMIEGLVKEETKPLDFTIKATDTKGKVEVVIPDGYSYVIENDKLYFITEKKDVTYPKTYEECCRVLGVSEFEYNHTGTKMWYRHKLMATLDNLMLCRDAYWKIAGEEMGLGKPWKPIDNSEVCYGIFTWAGEIQHDTTAKWCILTFPTEEMRDAFYENFKEEIEQCKELL